MSGQESLFGDSSAGTRADADEALKAAYARVGRTLDDLPYTPEFDAIFASTGGAYGGKRETFHRLHTLRKAGKLPKTGASATKPPKVTDDDEAYLLQLVTAAVGTIGQRDQLPFTPAMDRLVEVFNTRTGRSLDPHTVWRLIAKLAK